MLAFACRYDIEDRDFELGCGSEYALIILCALKYLHICIQENLLKMMNQSASINNLE